MTAELPTQERRWMCFSGVPECMTLVEAEELAAKRALEAPGTTQLVMEVVGWVQVEPPLPAPPPEVVWTTVGEPARRRRSDAGKPRAARPTPPGEGTPGRDTFNRAG